MDSSSSQPHTQQPMSPIHSFPTEDINIGTLFNSPLVRTLPSKLRPHQRIRSRLEDAKIGRHKKRRHPSALHEPMRKKLCCVKVGFTYPKIASLASGAGDEDYFATTLLDYEAEHEMPFTLHHCDEEDAVQELARPMGRDKAKCLKKSGGIIRIVIKYE
ncbi:hypothetical protein Tco_0851583 [Tanacetum coccineum]